MAVQQPYTNEKSPDPAVPHGGKIAGADYAALFNTNALDEQGRFELSQVLEKSDGALRDTLGVGPAHAVGSRKNDEKRNGQRFSREMMVQETTRQMINGVKALNEAEIAELREELQGLLNQMAEYQAEYDLLSEQNEVLRADNERLTGEIEQTEARRDELAIEVEEQTAEVDRTEARVESYVELDNFLSEREEVALTEQEVANTELATLVHEYQEAGLIEIQYDGTGPMTAQQAMSAYDALAAAGLEEEGDRLRDAQSAANNAATSVEDLGGSRAWNRRTLDELEEKHEEQLEQLEKLQEEYNAIEEELTEMREQLESNQEQIAANELRQQELSQKMDELTQKIEQVEQRIERRLDNQAYIESDAFRERTEAFNNGELTAEEYLHGNDQLEAMPRGVQYQVRKAEPEKFEHVPRRNTRDRNVSSETEATEEAEATAEPVETAPENIETTEFADTEPSARAADGEPTFRTETSLVDDFKDAADGLVREETIDPALNPQHNMAVATHVQNAGLG